MGLHGHSMYVLCAARCSCVWLPSSPLHSRARLLVVAAAPPGAPSRPKLEHASALSITISWKDGHDHGEAIRKYRVQFVRFPPEACADYDNHVHREEEVYAFRQPEEKGLFDPLGDPDEEAEAKVCWGGRRGVLQ